MLLFHFDVLNKSQKEVFEKLKIFKKEAVLAGGTALSLQIKHRHSFDFDLFFNRQLARKDILKLRRVLKIKKVGLNTSSQINIITADDILINLVFYPFNPLYKKITTPYISLFFIKDIALDKAFTIGRRAIWRDYVDLFFLLQNKYITLSEVIKSAPKKFGPEFNERLFLEQLVYFKDLEITKISFIGKNVASSEIKNFLIDEAMKYQKEIF